MRVSDGSSVRVQGPNSKALKFEPVMCTECNTTRSQSFDRAYEALSNFILRHEDEILRTGTFDLRLIYGPDWRARSDDALRYYVKHICCRLAECLGSGRVVLDESVFDFLEGHSAWPDCIAAEFFIDPGFLAITELLRAGGENPAHHEMTQIWADFHRPTGQIVGPQARLSNRWFRFAWQVDGFDPRPPPFASPIVELPRIDSLPAQEVENLRRRVDEVTQASRPECDDQR